MPRINLVRGFDGRPDVTEAFPLKPIHFEHAHEINMEPADSTADAYSTVHNIREIRIDNLRSNEVDQESKMDDNSRRSRSKSNRKNWKHKYSSRSLYPPTHRRQNRRSRSPTLDSRWSRSPTPDRRRFRSPDRRHDRRSRSRTYSDYGASRRSRSLTYSKIYRDDSRPRSEAYDALDIDRRRSARYRSPSPQDSYVYRSDRRADYSRRDDYGLHDDHSRRADFERRAANERLHSYTRDDHDHRHNPNRYNNYDHSGYNMPAAHGQERPAEQGYNARANHVAGNIANHDDRGSLNNTAHTSRPSSTPRPHRPGYFHTAPPSPPHHADAPPHGNSGRGRGIGNDYSASARSAQSGGRWRRPADERGRAVRGGTVRFRRGGGGEGEGEGEGAFLGRHRVARR